MKGESLWPRLAGLPLVIEACEYERLHAVLVPALLPDASRFCAPREN